MKESLWGASKKLAKKEKILFVWSVAASGGEGKEDEKSDYVRIQPLSFFLDLTSCVIEGEIVSKIVYFTIIIQVSTSR